MTEKERKAFENELAELKQQAVQLEGRPASTWSTAERAAGRKNATRVKRLMQLLIDDSRRAGSAG